jgi:hypothetical protein
MVNATIIFRNGTRAYVECETSGQLADIFSKYSRMVGTPEAVRAVPAVTAVRVRPVKTGKKRPTHRTWSARDIVEIGKIVSDNIDRKGVIFRPAMTYIKTKADIRNRTACTVFSEISNIKYYLKTGDPKRISAASRKALNNAGILPVTPDKFSVTPTRINVTRAPEMA